jgi:itaconate CoA-transferase
MNPYEAEYRKKLTTPPDAVNLIKDGNTVIVGVNFSEPPALLEAIARKAREGGLKAINTYSFNPQQYAAKTIFSPDLADCIRTHAWFVSSSIRNMVRVGLTYFIPSYLHQVPRLIRDHLSVDVSVTAVSPMDKAGYFSFGAASYISVAARLSKKVIVEVNENMPRVFGDALIHISEIDAIVENHCPLLEAVIPEVKPEDEQIGKLIAELIPDGACIQLGIGVIPNAVAGCLSSHKDLGVHSELLVPGMVDLIKKGVITGRKKTFHPRKHLFSVAYGNCEVYEFMNDNPSMESYASDYIMDPANIARNHHMISVNSILEVDLTGQCNAETIDGLQFSGTGGQLDFVRGAYNSPGGKSVLTFYSTAKNGEISRVVPRLESGAGVTTPRMDTHYLATEYGIVNVKGKSTRERALDIISIAHPRFRDELMREADNLRLI